MRSSFHLLLMMAVFFCGLHVAEPVQAHAEAVHHQLEHPANHDDGADTGAADAAHAMHHHCPIAPDQSSPSADGVAIRTIVVLAPALVTGLTSLSQAPPLEPPAA